jgi:hypothetical protein
MDCMALAIAKGVDGLLEETWTGSTSPSFSNCVCSLGFWIDVGRRGRKERIHC